MERIYIDTEVTKGVNAGSKARFDCRKILESYGYEERTVLAKKKFFFKSIKSVVAMLISIQKMSEVVLQYPLDNSLYITELIVEVCKKKKCKLSVLIHDINSFRTTGHIANREIRILKKADNLRVHNDMMCKILKNHICDAHYFILQTFDYLISQASEEGTFENTVVFAGNLKKSIFLKNIKNLGVKFNLYGAKVDELDLICNDMVSYKGVFQQDDLSALMGNWGLVWDGTSITTCDGLYGKYLKYNAPHKLSLYLVANLPVIIWAEAAEAEFVRDNKLGVIVNSLYEMKSLLEKITQEEYLEMKKNVEDYAHRLRGGLNLGYVLSQIEKSN